jgi:dynein heavy chain
MHAGVWQYTKSARGDWISQSLGMVTLAGSQVWWTWETEDVFDRVKGGDKHAMKRYAAKLTGQLSDLTHMVRPWRSAVQHMAWSNQGTSSCLPGSFRAC